MNATSFDSLAAARELKAAGVEGNQAEVFAEWMREASVANQRNFATKADLLATRADITRLEAHINTVAARLTAAIRTELAFGFNRMTLNMIAALAVLFAALKLF